MNVNKLARELNIALCLLIYFCTVLIGCVETTDDATNNASACQEDILCPSGTELVESCDNDDENCISVTYCDQQIYCRDIGEDNSDLPDTNNNNDEPLLAIIDISASTLEFEATPIGEISRQTLIVTNAGDGILKINSYTLDSDESFSTASNDLQELDIMPGDSIEIEVEFSPTTLGESTGELILDTNIEETPESTISLIGEGLPALTSILETDSFVRFNAVPAGQSEWTVIYLKNVGTGVVTIDSIAIEGDESFEMSFPNRTGAGVDDIQDDSERPPSQLEPGARIPIRIMFVPDHDDAATALLQIISNSEENDGVTDITLVGNSTEPCLKIIPNTHRIELGQRSIGLTSRHILELEKCENTDDLEINGIALSDSANGVFTAGITSLPGDHEELPVILSDDEIIIVEIAYMPVETEISTATLSIYSTDSLSPITPVEFVGKGVTNRCPNAVAEVRTMAGDFGSYRRTPINQPVELNGLSSTDTDGHIERFEWSILQRPQGSQATLQPNNQSPQPTFTPDIIGTYIFELTTYDNEGMASCHKSTTTVHGGYANETIITLTWNIPAVPEPATGNGTDLDLHYKHQNGDWNTSPWDVYYANRVANWGTEDDFNVVELVDDDLYGVGPETIVHSNDDNDIDTVYTVGVHYYASNGYGSSIATLKIYWHEVLVYEYLDKTISNCNDFWEVVSIGGENELFQQIDTVSQVNWAYCW